MHDPSQVFDQAADLQKNGAGTGIDTLRSNVQYQNERQRLIGAQTQLKTSLYALARLLNIDPHQNVELSDASEFFQTPEYSADDTIERAYADMGGFEEMKLMFDSGGISFEETAASMRLFAEAVAPNVSV